MKRMLKLIITSLIAITFFSGNLSAEVFSEQISLAKSQNEYSKILKQQQKDEEKRNKKQERKERRLEKKRKRYTPFDQEMGHGRMTDFRSEIGVSFSIDDEENEYDPIVNTDEISFNLFQLDLGLGPGFFIYGHVYGITGPFQFFIHDPNANTLAISYGGGIGFNKRIMIGRYPDNIYILGGANYFSYDWYPRNNHIYGESYLFHASLGYDMQLSKHWALNISDNFDYIPDCAGYSYYLNTVNLGIALTFPN